MERQVAWAAGRPGAEDLLLSFQSDTEAYYGRLTSAQVFSRGAIGSAIRAGSKETAALWQANAAVRAAELGDAATARQRAGDALAMSPGRDVKLFTALSFARARQTERGKPVTEGTEARASYSDFFALWKDADPDIPILREAKAEYTKLQ